MINLQRGLKALQEANINLKNGIMWLEGAIVEADKIHATELSGGLDIVLRNLKTLDPYSLPLETLLDLKQRYSGSLEEIDRKTKAAKLVAAITNVTMDKATRELAEKNVAEALASLDS
jgi:hypothetical protein